MHLVLRLFSTTRALEKAAGRVFKPLGLTSAQFNILNLLSMSPGGMRASDLASALIVDPSNVTGLLRRMMKEGLLEELENAGDRRQYIVGLSPKGRSVWRRANPQYERCLASLVAPFSRAEAAAAEKILLSLHDAAALLP